MAIFGQIQIFGSLRMLKMTGIRLLMAGEKSPRYSFWSDGGRVFMFSPLLTANQYYYSTIQGVFVKMLRNTRRPSGPRSGANRPEKLEKIVSMARSDADMRQAGYRAQSLKIHPWVCARCGRAFTQENLNELTVHHKDHNHDNNPVDGRNWENLCIYCHDNEHSRYVDHLAAAGMKVDAEPEQQATYNPFANLQQLLQNKQGQDG